MTTTHMPGTREWAEEQARKGAKVRRHEWLPDAWVTWGGRSWITDAEVGYTNWVWGCDDWTIHTPAPDDEAEIAAAEDALAEFHAKGGKPLEQVIAETNDEIQAAFKANPNLRSAGDFHGGHGTHNRVQIDADGNLDEVVTDGGAHLERMSNKRWFLSMSRADGSSYAAWFKGKITLTEEREPPAFMRAKQPARQFTTGLTAAQLPQSAPKNRPGIVQLDDFPGEVACDPEPWKPTPGRDAMTRDGRRVTGLHRIEGLAGTGLFKLVGKMDGGDYKFREDGRFSYWDTEVHPLDLIADWPSPAPEFKTTRRMSDEEIVERVTAHRDFGDGFGRQRAKYAVTDAIRLTRERIRADLEANEREAQEVLDAILWAYETEWDQLAGRQIDILVEAAFAALGKHGKEIPHDHKTP